MYVQLYTSRCGFREWNNNNVHTFALPGRLPRIYAHATAPLCEQWWPSAPQCCPQPASVSLQPPAWQGQMLIRFTRQVEGLSHVSGQLQSWLGWLLQDSPGFWKISLKPSWTKKAMMEMKPRKTTTSKSRMDRVPEGLLCLSPCIPSSCAANSTPESALLTADLFTCYWQRGCCAYMIYLACPESARTDQRVRQTPESRFQALYHQ